jgi:hypothetical protein
MQNSVNDASIEEAFVLLETATGGFRFAGQITALMAGWMRKKDLTGCRKYAGFQLQNAPK